MGRKFVLLTRTSSPNKISDVPPVLYSILNQWHRIPINYLLFLLFFVFLQITHQAQLQMAQTFNVSRLSPFIICSLIFLFESPCAMKWRWLLVACCSSNFLEKNLPELVGMASGFWKADFHCWFLHLPNSKSRIAHSKGNSGDWIKKLKILNWSRWSFTWEWESTQELADRSDYGESGLCISSCDWIRRSISLFRFQSI